MSLDDAMDKFSSEATQPRIQTRSKDLNELFGRNKDPETGEYLEGNEHAGFPLGRIATIHSQPGIGKSHIALEVSLAACSSGYKVAFIDVEKGLDAGLWGNFGLDEYFGETFFRFDEVDHFGHLQDLLDNHILQDDDIGLIVIDSLEAVNPVERGYDPEDDSDVSENVKRIEEMRPGEKSAQDSLFMRKYNSAFSLEKETSLFLVEQQRTSFNNWGTSQEPSCGNAVRFYSDLLFGLWQDTKYTRDDGDTVEAADLGVQFSKNKTDRCKEGRVCIRYGQGVAYDLLIMRKLLEEEENIPWFEKNGSWYKVLDDNDNEAFNEQGQDPLVDYIQDHEEWFIDRLRNEGFL